MIFVEEDVVILLLFCVEYYVVNPSLKTHGLLQQTLNRFLSNPNAEDHKNTDEPSPIYYEHHIASNGDDYQTKFEKIGKISKWYLSNLNASKK